MSGVISTSLGNPARAIMAVASPVHVWAEVAEKYALPYPPAAKTYIISRKEFKNFNKMYLEYVKFWKGAGIQLDTMSYLSKEHIYRVLSPKSMECSIFQTHCDYTSTFSIFH